MNYEGENVLDYLEEAQELFRIDITQAMRTLRARTGLNQTRVAEKLGVTQQCISRLESANANHSVENILAYLAALGAGVELSISIHWQGEEIAQITSELPPL